MDREAWRAAVHGVTENRTEWLNWAKRTAGVAACVWTQEIPKLCCPKIAETLGKRASCWRQKYKRQQYLFFQWSTGGRRQHSPGKEIGMASGKSLIHHCLAVWPGASPWPLSSSGRRECCPTTLWFPSLLLQEMCSVTAHFYLIHPSFVYYWMD